MAYLYLAGLDALAAGLANNSDTSFFSLHFSLEKVFYRFYEGFQE